MEINPANYILLNNLKEDPLFISKYPVESLFGLKRDEALFKFNQKGSSIATLVNILNFRLLLKSKSNMLDGNYKPISGYAEKESILQKLISLGDWRGYILNDEYLIQNDLLRIMHYEGFVNGEAGKFKVEDIDIDRVVMEEGYTSFDYLNIKGLPTSLIGSQLAYRPPKSRRIAMLSIGNTEIVLSCDKEVDYSNSKAGYYEVRSSF